MCEVWQRLLQEEHRLPTWKTLPTFCSLVEQNRISLDEELKGELKSWLYISAENPTQTTLASSSW